MKLDRTDIKLMKMLRFLIRLVILSIPLYLVLWLGVDLSPLQVSTASAANSVLTSLGWTVRQEGALLSANGFTFLLDRDCTGWKSMLFLFALVFAVPDRPLKKRLLGLVIGIPLVWFGNLMRVLATVGIQASHGTETALLVHDWLWQFGLIALVLVIWIAWLLSCRPRSRFRRFLDFIKQKTKR